jgi:ornithine cyclodeaminase
VSGPVEKGPAYLNAAAIAAAVPPAAAVEAVESALRGGVDPAEDVPRSVVPVRAGQLLLMPSESEQHVGVKVASVSAGNPARGLARISATYVLLDGETLRPLALLDGVALTALRTPAVSVAAVSPWLRRFDHPARLVVFGAGPQGVGHVQTLAAVSPLVGVDIVVRNPERVRLPDLAVDVRVLAAADGAVEAALREADVVVCATTARTPLFDSSLLGDGTVVIAVGSHEADAREVDGALFGRATVVVEDVATARRECGDVVMAEAEGRLDPRSLVPMRDVVMGRVPPGSTPVLFKGSGMSWEDLVVAEAVVARIRSEAGRGQAG